MNNSTLIRKLRDIENRLAYTMVLLHLFFDSRVDEMGKIDLDLIDEQYADVIMAIENLRLRFTCDTKVDQ